jgi:hypothetical protein
MIGAQIFSQILLQMAKVRAKSGSALQRNTTDS